MVKNFPHIFPGEKPDPENPENNSKFMIPCTFDQILVIVNRKGVIYVV